MGVNDARRAAALEYRRDWADRYVAGARNPRVADGAAGLAYGRIHTSPAPPRPHGLVGPLDTHIAPDDDEFVVQALDDPLPVALYCESFMTVLGSSS